MTHLAWGKPERNSVSFRNLMAVGITIIRASIMHSSHTPLEKVLRRQRSSRNSNSEGSGIARASEIE